MNIVMLTGRLTKEIELRFTPGEGKAVATTTVAVDKFVNGEKQADFIPLVIWGKQAENTANYCSKGSLIAVGGRISTRTYDAKDGTKRYVTEVVANEVQFLDSKKKEDAAVNSNETNMEFDNSSDIPF